jgi:hypothetical protein
MVEKADARLGDGDAEQGILDLAAGHVAGVDDAPRGVSALAAEIQLAVPGAAGEADAERLERGDPARAFGDALADHLLVGQSAAGGQRVANVGLERVVGADDGGDPALGPAGGALLARALGQDQDVGGACGLERVGQACDAGAEDQVVGAKLETT